MTQLLLERLEGWKHVTSYLEDYIGATEKVQKAHVKEYEKILKVGPKTALIVGGTLQLTRATQTISHPIREQQQFEKGVGGVTGLFDNLKAKTQASHAGLPVCCLRG